MSPSEDELRTALSDGAGDVPDVDQIVFAARERREQRRRTALSVAGAVVLVGALGTGGTYLARHGSTSGNAGDAGGERAGFPAAAAAGGTVVGPGNGSGGGGGSADANGTTTVNGASGSGGTYGSVARGVQVTCPSRVPDMLLPGGGGTTQFGSTATLFAQPVATVTVCAVPTGGGTTTQVQLTGAQASALAGSLDNAATTRPDGMCPDIRFADQMSLAIIATTTSGRTLPTVTTTINEPACAVIVSNGTAVRYAWSPPAALRHELATASGAGPGGLPAPGSTAAVNAPGRVEGSPVH